jgi:esterase/lipase superfamily enzyme
VAARDIFVGCTSADRDWADWIGRELEAAGFTILIQVLDIRPGINLLDEMQKGAEESLRTLIVLSPSFLELKVTEAELTSTFGRDPTGQLGKLVPVRVVECNLAGLLGPRIYIDLVGLREDAARGALLDAVKGGTEPEGGPICVVLEKETAMDLFLALTQALGAPIDKKTKGKKKEKGKGVGPKGPMGPKGPKMRGLKGLGPKGPLNGRGKPKGKGAKGTIVSSGSGPGEPDPRSVTVLFATNRGVTRNAERKLERLSSKRSPFLTYGEAAVRVPEIHMAGLVERARTYFSVWGIKWTEKEKDTAHFTLSEVIELTEEEFATAIRDYQSSTALLFVHGFNTDSNEAIFRLAQIVWDTQFRGVPVAFLWPSKGEVTAYGYDRESVLCSVGAFRQVLGLLSKNANISNIYVVAHSMGNQIVMQALEGVKIELTEVVLAAPDVDLDLFLTLSDQLKKVAKGITLYASAADKALLVSQLKAQGPRAGYISSSGPLILPGIETIDVTAVGDDMLSINHDVYSSNREVLTDIGRLLISGIHPPNDRTPLIRGVPEGSAQPDYWKYAY